MAGLGPGGVGAGLCPRGTTKGAAGLRTRGADLNPVELPALARGRPGPRFPGLVAGESSAGPPS